MSEIKRTLTRIEHDSIIDAVNNGDAYSAIPIVEQILNARVKPVNEDRIKEIIKGIDRKVCGIRFEEDFREVAHAIAVEFAGPANKALEDEITRLSWLRDCAACYLSEKGADPKKGVEILYGEQKSPVAVSTCDHEPLDVDKLETFMQSLENMNYPRGAKEWAKEICDRFCAPGLSELTSLKQRIDGITVEDLKAICEQYNYVDEVDIGVGTLKRDNYNTNEIAVAIHDKIKGV